MSGASSCSPKKGETFQLPRVGGFLATAHDMAVPNRLHGHSLCRGDGISGEATYAASVARLVTSSQALIRHLRIRSPSLASHVQSGRPPSRLLFLPPA